MLKVAILDDYQNVSQQFVDLEKLSGKYEIKIFSEPFENDADTLDKLSDFEALLIMRERTPITKDLIDNLSKLKFIITSGTKNSSIDLEAAKKRKIIVCGTEMNTNPTPELTWCLLLGLAKNLKEEIDNMYQGYWQTTIGIELFVISETSSIIFFFSENSNLLTSVARPRQAIPLDPNCFISDI